jgi:hypothetical protein
MALCIEPQIVKRLFAETGAARLVQESRRENLIRVDVDPIKRSSDGSQRGERLHRHG